MTDTLVVYNPDGTLDMIVHDAANPNDLAWNPPGSVTVSIPRAQYDFCADQFAVMTATMPSLQAANPQVAANAQGIVNAQIAAVAALNAANAAAVLVTPAQDNYNPVSVGVGPSP